MTKKKGKTPIEEYVERPVKKLPELCVRMCERERDTERDAERQICHFVVCSPALLAILKFQVLCDSFSLLIFS
jgi:hypothetical protein